MPSNLYFGGQSSQNDKPTRTHDSFDQRISTQVESNIRTTSVELEPYYRILGVNRRSSLQEVDVQYLELSSVWGGPNHPGNHDDALRQVQLIDEAYLAVLPSLMGREKEHECERKHTMKGISTGQDRILPASVDGDMFWIHADVPPRPIRKSSPPEDDSLELSPNFSKPAPSFSIEEIYGTDLLDDAPDHAVIIHAVSCQGVWGSGIALKLKKDFPAAYQAYQTYCKMAEKPADLIGKCLLIPPQEQDYKQNHKAGMKGLTESADDNGLCKGGEVLKSRKWIACLFTSIGYGRKNMRINNPGKDSPAQILIHTREALELLRVNLEGYGETNFDEETSWKTDDDIPGELWCCKFNSGAFGVKWSETEEILQEEFAGFERPFYVMNNLPPPS